jgi:hypothetical protein
MEYGKFPPLILTVAVPLFTPLMVCPVLVVVKISAAGCVRLTLVVAEHPSVSVTVTAWIPAARPDAVAVVLPDDQL